MQSVYLCVIFHEKHEKSGAAVLRRLKALKNRFEILLHIKNSGGEVPSTARFPLLKCTTVGRMNLRVRPRVDMFLKSNSLSETHAPYSLLNSS